MYFCCCFSLEIFSELTLRHFHKIYFLQTKNHLYSIVESKHYTILHCRHHQIERQSLHCLYQQSNPKLKLHNDKHEKQP